MIALGAVGATLLALLAGAGCPASAAQPDVPPRIVSINPSLTSILIALGAGESLVGVDDYSARQQPEVADLPRVGGLHDTSLEAVAELQPDLVVLVPSVEQRDLRTGLDTLGIAHREFAPIEFEEVLDTILALGEIVSREAAASERVAEIRRTRRRIEAERRSAPLRGVLVITRDPLFVVGPGSFIDEMLSSAGVENLGRSLVGTYPRASLEWLVAEAPELILDADGDAAGAVRFWSRWPSLPAVRSGRVVSIPQEVATLPGPHLDRGLELLARSVRGDPPETSP
ncbi:MAG: helical backbone metal receptor [Myxococcota bacterium]